LAQGYGSPHPAALPHDGRILSSAALSLPAMECKQGKLAVRVGWCVVHTHSAEEAAAFVRAVHFAPQEDQNQARAAPLSGLAEAANCALGLLVARFALHGRARSSLGTALRVAEVRAALAPELARSLRHLALAADALRHLTGTSVDRIVQDLRAAFAQHSADLACVQEDDAAALPVSDVELHELAAFMAGAPSLHSFPVAADTPQSDLDPDAPPFVPLRVPCIRMADEALASETSDASDASSGDERVCEPLDSEDVATAVFSGPWVSLPADGWASIHNRFMLRCGSGEALAQLRNADGDDSDLINEHFAGIEVDGAVGTAFLEHLTQFTLAAAMTEAGSSAAAAEPAVSAAPGAPLEENQDAARVMASCIVQRVQ